MPLDAVCLQAVVAELAPQITGSRIEKIQQPARDQVVLLLRGNRRLLLSAGGGQPRLHLTELPRDNPAQPPMFCMLLRKYLSGGIIESIQQAPLERVVTLTVSAADELGERSQFSLILEAVARRANLILADKDGHIIDCLRRIDFEMNPDRQVLPGLFYHLPTPPDKVSPFTVTEEEFAALAAAAGEGAPADQWLVRTVNGLSPLVARELTFRACGSTDAPVTGHTVALWSAFAAWRDTVNEKCFTPAMLKRSGVPMDFTYLNVGQYGGAAEEETYPSFSHLLDDFYEKREQAERVKQKGQDLVKTASNGAARLRRKIAAQEQELAESKSRDKWRVYGELITANLYRMERGMSRLTAQNYYDPDCADVDIPLDVRLSPQENAAKYFKKYTKAKTAEKYITAQLEKARVELTYLESVLQELTLAESEQDFNDIRAELTDGGYQQAQGIPLHGGAAHPCGAQQPAKRPADRQGRGKVGHLAPHPENTRLPRDTVHRRRTAGRAEPAGSGVAGGVFLPGAGRHEGAGGLCAGKVREEARRFAAGIRELHQLQNHFGRPQRGAGEAAGSGAMRASPSAKGQANIPV